MVWVFTIYEPKISNIKEPSCRLQYIYIYMTKKNV